MEDEEEDSFKKIDVNGEFNSSSSASLFCAFSSKDDLLLLS